MKKFILSASMLLLATSTWAGSVEIKNVKFEKQVLNWNVYVTLKHADTGWEHYADGWRIVDSKGNVLGHRTLYHPHVDEQPFTRSLSDVVIPQGVDQVIIEARDTVHGWSKDKVVVNLKLPKGERFTVRR